MIIEIFEMFEPYHPLEKQMKLRLILCVAAILLLARYECVMAADLSVVRTGKHENFTRVVFEFKNAVQFNNPEIKGKGKFSLVFLNSTTKLPRLTLYKTGKTQLVHSVEFVRQKSNLTAIVRLAFPYFILKSYALSSPDRIVVDAYWMSSPLEKSEQKASLPEEPVAKPLQAPDKKEIKTIVQKTSEKAAPEASIAPLSVNKPLVDESKTSQNVFSKTTTNQVPDKKKISSPSPRGNNIIPIYLLVVLDVLAGCIVVLLILTLFKKKQVIDIGRLCEILDFIKASDQSITSIDTQIKRAFKQYDQS